MNVLFIINNGFEETETVGPYDILKRAGYRVDIASNNTSALGAHGITIDKLIPLSKVAVYNYDLLVLPGGPQYMSNKDDKLYLETMKYFVENKKIAAICATPTILGAHGYLKGKRYTCFPPMNKDFGGTFTGEDATIDGNLITGRGAGSSLIFGYKIIEALEGIEKSREVEGEMHK